MTEIALDQLHAHPGNSNVMKEKLFRKLVDHLRRSGRYPPVIVRPWQGAYQILDGHHRVMALRELGAEAAQCLVWDADDEESLVLLTTLNRLQGVDDPRKRGELITQLMQRRSVGDLSKLLPEGREQLQKLAAVSGRPPALRPPQRLEGVPVAVTFFLLPDEKRKLEAALDQRGPTREAALMALLEPPGDCARGLAASPGVREHCNDGAAGHGGVL